MDITSTSTTPAPQPDGMREPEKNALAETWGKRIAASRKAWEKFHKRVQHNRTTVAGFNWEGDPNSADFYKHRANLIHGTITAILPNIYARNPEIAATPIYKQQNLKLFCSTLQAVTNRHLEMANLKGRAKMTVRSALTSSYGIVKVMYQRDIRRDPVIQSRIDDTQDNILAIEKMLVDLENPTAQCDHESKLEELRQTMRSLEEQVEVTAAEGLVIDRVLTENLLMPADVCEFWDYPDSPWLCQVIPMRKGDAEAQYKVKLDGAKAYHDVRPGEKTDQRFASGSSAPAEDQQIAVLEIWDKTTQTIYTMAEGCSFWLREPYSPPKAGERWYPFFLLPFQTVDGQFVAPSLVDLTEKLQKEHNDTRDKYNKHRDLCQPGWVAGNDVSEKSIKRYTDSTLGEITIVDTNGQPIQSFIVPRQHPPMDPMVYDVSGVRYDWEQVTGMQDAARSTVVDPKTATEASIMQQALSGRVSEFRDQVEDWLQGIAQYAAQILLFELTPAQVERIMGPAQEQQVEGPMGPMTAKTPTYDWPQLSREQVFDMVEMKIRAGTTGAPNKAEEQEIWGKVLPVIQGLVTQIMQIQATGGDAEPFIALLRETINRFDDKLDVETFIPKPPAMPAMPMPPGAGMPQGLPMQPA